MVERISLHLARQVRVTLTQVAVALNDGGSDDVSLQRAVQEGIALRRKLLLDVDEVVGAAIPHRVANFDFVAHLNNAAGDRRGEARRPISEQPDASVVARAPLRGASVIFRVPRLLDVRVLIL